MKIFNHIRHHSLLYITTGLLATGVSVAATQTLKQNTESQMPPVVPPSPYSIEGVTYYERLCSSPQFYQILKQQQSTRSAHEVEQQVHLGTLYSLAAWDSSKDANTQLNYFKLADAAFDAALKQSPHHWDAWMAKAELYAHSGHQELIPYAKEILQQLVSPQSGANSYKRNYATGVLTKLSEQASSK